MPGRDGHITSRPYRALRKDGSYIWIESTIRPIRDAAGAVTELQVSARDVTDRVTAERRLRKSRSMLARAESMAGIGSWEWDLLSGEVRWSDELFRILGVDPRSFTPAYGSYLERVVPEDRERIQSIIEQARESGSDFHYECGIERPDGERLAIEAHGEMELDEEGRPRRMRGTVQDVTERRRAQDRLSQMHAELKRRTDELERSNLELEQFAYDASHDLGEPLRIMSRLARTMAETYGDDLDERGTQLLTRWATAPSA